MFYILEDKGNRIRITFNKEVLGLEGKYRIEFNKEETLKLYEELVKLIKMRESLYKDLVNEDNAYNEEFTTYKDEVERTLIISKNSNYNMVLILICYTDDDSDDNWIELTDRKILKLTNYIGGYIDYVY